MNASSAAPASEAVLVRALLALTVVTGLIDAVSYLGLGRTFTANMTGNRPRELPDASLPHAVATGAEPFLVVGALAGG